MNMSSLPYFQVLAVASDAADHAEIIDAAFPFFQQMAEENNFTVHVTRDADEINDENLTHYQVFVMFQSIIRMVNLFWNLQRKIFSSGFCRSLCKTV